jgi:protein TonB
MIASTSLAAPTLTVASPLAASFEDETVEAPNRPSIDGATVVDDGQIQILERSPARAKPFPMLLETGKRKTPIGPVAAAVVALAIIGFAVNSYASKTRGRVEAQSGAELRRDAQGPAAQTVAAVAAPAVVAVARPDSSPPAGASSRSPAKVSPPPVVSTAKAPQPTPQRDAPTALPSAPVALPTVAGVAIPNIVTPNVDSIMRASAKTKIDRDSYAEIATAGKLRTQGLGDDRVASPPLLIGAVPQPRFPDALRAQRIEGDVVVQFLVDVNGRVDPTSMKVVRSPHELFTNAVRNVLPNFRFEPARTAPPESKPRAEWVQIRLQFNLKS